MERINVTNLYKTIENQGLLNNANLRVDNGEICAVIGPNGAGKTSLIKCILGLLKQDVGDILINGQQMSTITRNDLLREIGTVLQFPLIIGKLTVEQVFNEHFHYYEVNTTGAIQDLLKKVELPVSMNSLAKNLSLGMKQRLLLSLALAHQPKILILDEPFNGLDVDGIKLIKDILKAFAAMGNSVLITSHSLSELQDLATNVVFMKNGTTTSNQKMGDIVRDFEGGLLQYYEKSKTVANVEGERR
ncbi:ABC transporter ATP-binding protein [Niallia sp. FSL R7-0271]|uniref:ABC transporter ATP-binding protein n=1 Tax=Niallia sp. FSL R7-0271 TaxID=2921678 RepID=UPI0030F8843A